MNPNPFEVSDSRQHGVADVHARDTPIVYKPTFILLWFIGNVALSLSYFFIINAIDPCMSIDLPFYRNLYAAIGAMSAVLSLFIGHLVVARRLSVQSVILLLTLPYLFVVFVAAGLGPLVAVLITLLFGSVVALAYRVRPDTLTPQNGATNHPMHGSGEVVRFEVEDFLSPPRDR